MLLYRIGNKTIILILCTLYTALPTLRPFKQDWHVCILNNKVSSLQALYNLDAGEGTGWFLIRKFDSLDDLPPQNIKWGLVVPGLVLFKDPVPLIGTPYANDGYRGGVSRVQIPHCLIIILSNNLLTHFARYVLKRILTFLALFIHFYLLVVIACIICKYKLIVI